VNQNSRRYTCGQGCFLDRGKVFHTPVFGAIHQRCRSFAEITRKIILNIFAATAYEKIVHDNDFAGETEHYGRFCGFLRPFSRFLKSLQGGMNFMIWSRIYLF
jgi:hypothetical protein